MNETSNEMQVIESSTIGSTAMMFSSDNFERALKFADAMASASISVPVHLRDKPGDCLAIVMQAAQWGMNPFAVAQKTHIVNGTLGYEAQLVNAVIQASGAIKGRFNYEYRGEGAALECRVGAVITGENDITWGEWLLSSSVTTKNSPLWKTNPKQQLGYLQVKNWSRAYCPGAILGVYDYDELANAPTTKDMGSIDKTTGEVTHPEKPALPPCPQDVLDAEMPKWQKVIEAGKKTAQAILDMAVTRYTLTTEQKMQILALEAKPAIDAEFIEQMEGAEQ